MKTSTRVLVGLVALMVVMAGAATCVHYGLVPEGCPRCGVFPVSGVHIDKQSPGDAEMYCAICQDSYLTHLADHRGQWYYRLIVNTPKPVAASRSVQLQSAADSVPGLSN